MAWGADIAGIMPTFKIPGGVTVTRRSGTRTDGFWVAGAASTFTLDPVVIHPAQGRDLLTLPEGQRGRETYILYTLQKLIAGSQPNGYLPDLVSYNGQSLEVQTSEFWADNGAYYRAMAQLVPSS